MGYVPLISWDDWRNSNTQHAARENKKTQAVSRASADTDTTTQFWWYILYFQILKILKLKRWRITHSDTRNSF